MTTNVYSYNISHWMVSIHFDEIHIAFKVRSILENFCVKRVWEDSHKVDFYFDDVPKVKLFVDNLSSTLFSNLGEKIKSRLIDYKMASKIHDTLKNTIDQILTENRIENDDYTYEIDSSTKYIKILWKEDCNLSEKEKMKIVLQENSVFYIFEDFNCTFFDNDILINVILLNFKISDNI